MKKVVILGSPGAGKTTFARKLQAVTKLPLYHLDMIWHKPDKTNITREEFDEKLQEIMSSDEWIIDGNYSRTCEIRIRNCDTVFLLDFPLELCLKGAEERIGKERPDMPWVEEAFDEEFKQWILDFPTEQLPKLYKTIEKYNKDKSVIIFKTREETDEYINRLQKSC